MEPVDFIASRLRAAATIGEKLQAWIRREPGEDIRNRLEREKHDGMVTL